MQTDLQKEAWNNLNEIYKQGPTYPTKFGYTQPSLKYAEPWDIPNCVKSNFEWKKYRREYGNKHKENDKNG